MMKILLLQARTADDPAKAEEHASFADKAGLPLSAFHAHDLLTGPPPRETITDCDAMMIGGSGEFSVAARSLPHLQETLDMLAAVIGNGVPVFASCFGFHLISAALGGEVTYNPAGTEVGTYEITLTEAGEKDSLFGQLPKKFRAQLGHKDYVRTAPPGFINLGSSAMAPVQAMRLAGQPVWATQFHPELSGTENLSRFKRYMQVYKGIMSEAELTETLNSFKPSRESNRLIPLFLKSIAG